MNITIILLGITIALNIILGGIVFLHSKKGKSELFYFFISFSVIIWASALLLFEIYESKTTLLIATKIAHASAIAIAISFVYFAHFFPKKEFLSYRTKFLLLFLLLLAATLYYVTLFSTAIISNTTEISKTYSIGNYYIFYILYIVSSFSYGFYVLYKKLKGVEQIERLQIWYALSGTLLSTLFAIITNLVFPLFNIYSYVWLGPIFTFLMVIAFTYAILKYRLFDVRIIFTELLTVVIWLFFFIRVLVAESWRERIIDSTLFFILVFFGVLLIRSVLKEVQNREQIEGLAEQLQNANTELSRINQAKSDFISMASHQLKTPLSIIKGYVSMSLEGSFGKITKKLGEQLKKVYISNERLIALVDDLLNLSRVEEGRMKYDWAEENLTDIIQTIVDEMENTIKQKHGLKLIWNKPEKPIVARVDSNKIRNVLFNLIDNATKYTQKGSITIAIKKTGGSAIISVTDTGFGIPADQLPKLFTKFTRVLEGAASLGITGFGLGLYMARLVTEAHEGRIWAESDGLGKGSAFFVELPMVISNSSK